MLIFPKVCMSIFNIIYKIYKIYIIYFHYIYALAKFHEVPEHLLERKKYRALLAWLERSGKFHEVPEHLLERKKKGGTSIIIKSF